MKKIFCLWMSLFLLFPVCIAWADNTADELLSRGNRLYEEEHYEASIPCFAQAVDLYARSRETMAVAVARHQWGFALLGAKQFSEAIVQFEENQRFHKSHGRLKEAANYLMYIALALQHQGNDHAALTYLGQAHDLTPRQSDKAEIAGKMLKAHLERDHPDAAQSLVTRVYCHQGPELYDRHIRPLAESFHLSPGVCDALRWSMGGAVGLWAVGIVWRWPVNGTLLLVSLSLAIVAGEGVLRWLYGSESVRHFLFAPNRVTHFSPEPGVMPGVAYLKSHFTINNVGLRGDPFPRNDGVFKVVAIGGSTTEGLFLDDADVWTQRLQTHLSARRRVWVGNSGKSGLNSFGHLVQVRYHLQEMQPQLLVVMAGINDLNQCISGGLTAMRDNARLAKEAGYTAYYRQHVFEQIQGSAEPSWQWYRLWKKIQEQNNPALHRNNQPYVIQDKAGAYYTKQRERRQMAIKVATEPDIEECLTVFHDNLTRISEMARAANVPLVFVTQGSLYKEEMLPDEESLLWFGAVGSNFFDAQPVSHYYTAKSMNRLLSRYNNTTLELCRTEKRPCFETDTALPKDTTSYYDDVHFNVPGSHRLGKKLAEFLETILNP